MDCRSAMMLDDERAHAVLAEQQRSGHADHAAADHEDRHFDLSHETAHPCRADPESGCASGALLMDAILHGPAMEGNVRGTRPGQSV